MKIMFITDIHNNYKDIEKLLLNNIDVIIIGGDFTIRGGRDDVKKILDNIIKIFKGKILAVPGNMDKKEVLDVLIDYNINIECSGVIIEDIGFFGCGGSEKTPFDTPNEKDSNDIYRCLVTGYNSIKEAGIKVMVSHNPPFNTKCDKVLSGNSVGSKKVREFIENYLPDYCLTGHIHEGIASDIIGKTVVVNPGPFQNGRFAIIDIKTAQIFLNKL
ncbi:MAG TPA: metallophosphoesterase [Spirochaetota bacterium]|mgnify:CR=1 FL=1|nr:metallophosphoesterase [Spirochaetota bacterium]HOM38247.1 metallophosphoesterase [Spirochaetota bacterium]HPQ48535.1 metallophosphoesterase [Spirochaetota bacterium]